MSCIICGSPTAPYFAKDYSQCRFAALMAEGPIVHYDRCTRCGFVLSRTHREMPKERWERLNEAFHSYTDDDATENFTNSPPYAEQAEMLAALDQLGIINLSDAVDYAGGSGKLSQLLREHNQIDLPVFDPYMAPRPPVRRLEQLGRHATIINSAMFEHILTRRDLDSVNDAVKPDGALVIHTLVCERVPADPNWFYLIPPVHTAFHTNASMDLLMDQWGYKSSIYSPKSKFWVLLRQPADEVRDLVAKRDDWHLKDGFVDYWKGF